MKIAIAHLESTSPYSQSKYVTEKKTRNEKDLDFEERIWRKRCHVDEKGMVVIPGIQFKKSLEEAAKYKSIQIPGKNRQTYTKHFLAGMLCLDNLSTGIHVDKIEPETVLCDARGKRDGTTRVPRIYPRVPSWKGAIKFLILDEIIEPEVFKTHLIDAGQFVGLGRWRAGHGGMYGRFVVKSVDWKDE